MDYISAASPHESQQLSSTGGMENNANPDDWLDIALGIAGPQDDWFLNLDGGDGSSLFFSEDKSLPSKADKMGMNSLGKASMLRSAFSTGDLQSLEIPADFSPHWAPMTPSSANRRLESVPENSTSNGGPLPVAPITLPTPQPTPTYPDSSIAPAFQEQKPQLQHGSNGEPMSANLESLSIEQLEAQLSLAQQQQHGLATGNPPANVPPPIDPAANPFLNPTMNSNVSSNHKLQFPQQSGPQALPHAPPSLLPPASQPQAFPMIKQSSSAQDLAAMTNTQNGGNGMYGMMGAPMAPTNADANSNVPPMPMPFMMPGPHGTVMPPQAFHAYSALMNPAAPPLHPPPSSQVSPVPNLAQQPHQPLLPPLTAAALHQQPHQPQQQQHQMHGNGPSAPTSPFPQGQQGSQMSSNAPMDFSQGAVNRPPFPVSSQLNDLGHPSAGQSLSISTAPLSGQQQQQLHQQLLTSPHAPLQPMDAPRGLRKSQSCMELASWRSQSSLDLTELVQPSAPGKLTPEERAAKIMRYKQKRNERNFNRTIKYQCRKTLADTRPRVRGRFARNNDPESVPPELTKKALREKAKVAPVGVKAEAVDGMMGNAGMMVMGENGVLRMVGGMNGTAPQGSSSHTTTTSTDDSLDLPSLSDPMAMLVDSAASSATSAFDYIASASSTPMMVAPQAHMYPQYNHFLQNQSTA